jgi:AMP nucleosidase
MTFDSTPETAIVEAPKVAAKQYTSASEAVDAITELYLSAQTFLTDRFNEVASGAAVTSRYRAYYPYIEITTTTHSKVDTRLSFGHVAEPGTYATTLTDPVLFHNYLKQQIGILISNHNVPVTVGQSNTPIPLHFALSKGHALVDLDEADLTVPLRDVFDVPDLGTINDTVANCGVRLNDHQTRPLSMFNAQRVDYSLARLAHYTATDPEHFQNFVLFTNYQFYIDDFIAFAEL